MKIFKWIVLVVFFILVFTGVRFYNYAKAEQKSESSKQLKADSICIGNDCRDKWPVFKCANYQGRPAGETGDEFCASMNKTCMAVSIGGGQSFFDECSVPANSVHKCRCCWAE